MAAKIQPAAEQLGDKIEEGAHKVNPSLHGKFLLHAACDVL